MKNKNKKKFIAALESGKYEKNQGSFVPTKIKEENEYEIKYELARENCACALGVYLIEIKGIPAEELAKTRYTAKASEYYKILERDFVSESIVGDIWRINDARRLFGEDELRPVDETFGTVIEYLKGL